MFKFSENFNYAMPAHFGGYEGQPKSATYHDVTMIKITYETCPLHICCIAALQPIKLL